MLSKFLVDIYVYVSRVVLFSIVVRETPFYTGWWVRIKTGQNSENMSLWILSFTWGICIYHLSLQDSGNIAEEGRMNVGAESLGGLQLSASL